MASVKVTITSLEGKVLDTVVVSSPTEQGEVWLDWREGKLGKQGCLTSLATMDELGYELRDMVDSALSGEEVINSLTIPEPDCFCSLATCEECNKP